VAQQLPQGELVSEAPQLGHVLAERSIEFEIPVRNQNHRQSCREGFADRADGEGRVPVNWISRCVPELAYFDRNRRATVVDSELGPRHLVFARQRGQRVEKPMRVQLRPELLLGGCGTATRRDLTYVVADRLSAAPQYLVDNATVLGITFVLLIMPWTDRDHVSHDNLLS
jgi:hypothetical protein